MKHARSVPLAVALVGIAGAWVSVVAAAGLSGANESALWQGRAAAADPPQLWSIEAMPSRPGWRPVQLCTDSWMRTGFVRPEPMIGDQPCAPVGDPIESQGRLAFRCTVNGHTLGATMSVAGDLETDFTTRVAVTHLAGFMMARPQSAYEQTLRYRKLGACPEGWAVSDHTDRWGRRQSNAILAHSSQIAVR